MSAKTSFLLLLGVGALPILAALAGLYRLITSPAEEHLAPIVDLCQMAYKQTLDTTGHVILSVLVLMLVFIGLRIGFVLFSSWRKTTKIMRLDRAPRASDTLLRAKAASLNSGTSASIKVVQSQDVIAVTVGLISPSIILSTTLVDLLTNQELEAVVRHEAAHAMRKDPLRSLLTDSIRLSLPFVPIITQVADQFRIQREVEADASVVRAMGSPVALAGALLKTLKANDASSAYEPGISPTEARIDILLGRTTPARNRIALILAGVLSAVLVGAATVGVFVVAAHPGTVTLHIC